MELTRRDALAALAASGVAVGGGAVLLSDDESPDRPVDDDEMRTLVAAAEVLYPDEVEGVEGFVRRYVEGRGVDTEHATGMADAVAYVDEYAKSWYDAEFEALDAGTRDAALRRMGADGVEPDPHGSDVQRVRYYVVNELLYALYSSPTGGKLVGIENPQGHPGGTASYQRGPGE